MDEDRMQFHTFRGYTLIQREDGNLTPSMEDYLEMIYRLSGERGYTRINDLSQALSVQPPSTTKMVQRLAKYGYLRYERYGILELTSEGRKLGNLLLKRHEMLEDFLRLLGVKGNVLHDTERIEHIISDETLECINGFVEFAKANPEWLQRYRGRFSGVKEG